MTQVRRNPGARSGAVLTGQVETNATKSPMAWVPNGGPPQDPVDSALAAVGFAIDIRDVLRRLETLRDGAS